MWSLPELRIRDTGYGRRDERPMSLHRRVLPYSGLFMVFMDYCRPSFDSRR